MEELLVELRRAREFGVGLLLGGHMGDRRRKTEGERKCGEAEGARTGTEA
jgi:hypothetical protein